MPESYPEQLAARLRGKEAAGRSLNKAAFIAAKADIGAALDAGFVPKDIWHDLRACGRIGFSYDTFLRMMKHYLIPPPVATKPAAEAPPKLEGKEVKEHLAAAKEANRVLAPEAVHGFRFGPHKKFEDLI